MSRMKYMYSSKDLSEITKIAEYSAPIRMLLKKNVPWVWSDCQNKSFLKIKEEFRSTSILKTFSMDRKTYLTTGIIYSKVKKLKRYHCVFNVLD